MRLCSYTITHDAGFAPNPFGEYCTVAACTPNHQGVRLHRGDWLAGHATADRGQGLIYAMKVTEVLNFDAYYNDPRFEYKSLGSIERGARRVGTTSTTLQTMASGHNIVPRCSMVLLKIVRRTLDIRGYSSPSVSTTLALSHLRSPDTSVRSFGIGKAASARIQRYLSERL